ncbi:MAG: YceI family protein [Beijerinckiaceae bacterium]|nr:YceI family protein [Beijerinckiaceae bacterium]
MTDISPPGRYRADINHSSLIWRIKHFGLSWYTGRFTRFESTLDFKPDAIETMKLDVSVDIASVRGEYQGTDKDWDDELANSANFFQGKTYPKASFTSARIEKKGDAMAKVHGDLTIKGITRPLTLDAIYNGSMLEDPFKRTLIGFSATGTITRSQFGLTYFLGPLLPDEVQLIIETEMVLER